MYAWCVRFMIRRSIQRHQAGDVEALLAAYADDVRFVFPGQSSWSADLRGKNAIEPWLRRFHRVGIQLDAHEILVNGPPWNTTVCVRITDRAMDSAGQVVYSNRGVIFGKVVWGKITYYEVYEDTQKLSEFDNYLAEHEPAARVNPLEPAARKIASLPDR